jgi:hypothetical protein
MKKMYLMKGMAVMALGLIVASCNRMEFAGQPQISDEEALTNAELALGFEINPNQDWNMTQDVQANISVKMGTGEDYTLIVYDKNPFLFDDAVYYAKQKISDGASVKLNLNVPSARETLYVTLMENDGLNYSMTTLISDNALNAEFTSETSNAPAMRRVNSGDNYPATSTGINANANEWADPNKGFGGWLVPDPLTDEQKDVVRQYFQAVPNRTYQDPEWRHFFVQQVYKGATQKPTTGNKEVTSAADGMQYTSSNMNLLTVGYNEQHINNFNDGNCSVNNVLTNGGTVNDGPYHSDQIMLMVNIDDTQCMGYHNTGSSLQQNNKAGLVGWETIRTWANNNLGAGKGDCLNDGWNRSFVGFDFELYSLEDSYAKNNGNKTYAPISDVPGNTPQYVWDGSKVLKKGSSSAPRMRAVKRRTGETSVDVWKGNETKSYNNSIGDFTFSGKAQDLLNAGNYLGVDLSPVSGSGENWQISFKGAWGTSLSAGNITLSATSKNAEIQLTDDDVAILSQQGLRIWSLTGSPVNFTRVYISEYSQANGSGSSDNTGNDDNTQNQDGQEETNYDSYNSNYIVIDGKEIPYLNTNMNMYGGIQRSLSDGDMKINKDGKECLNLPAFKALVDEGYLPVKDKNLRTWVKWQGGDGYYSDWIVTLTEAKRAPKQETHEEQPHQTPAIYSYAFEDTRKGDYDMNDVVLKVQENEDGEHIDIKLVAAGATLDLNIRLYDYDESGENGYGENYITLSYNGETEIHKMWNVDAGTMVNTGAGATANPITIQIDKTGYDSSKLRLAIYSESQREMRLAGSGQAPFGVIIPADWKWPRERVCIKNAYKQTNATAEPEDDRDQSFEKYASKKNTTKRAKNWFKYPTGSVMDESDIIKK